MELNGYSADPINRGIDQIFKAITMAPMMRQQAQQQASLMDAQAYHAAMTGNQAAAQTDKLRLAQQQQENALKELSASTDPFEKNLRILFQLMEGNANPANLTQGALNYQKGNFRQQVLDNYGNPGKDRDRVSFLNSMLEGKTYEPYTPIGDTGYMANRTSGNIIEGNPMLTNSFAQKQQTQNALHQAQTYQASAAGNKYQAEAMLGGQGNRQYWEGVGKNLADYEKNLNGHIEVGNRVMLKLDSQIELLKEFTPGAGMEVRENLARKAQAMGLNKLADDIARGNLGAVQAFQKTSVQSAMEQLRQSMDGASRVAVAEYVTFKENNPNITTDPRAIEKVYALARRMHQADVDELKAFDEYRKTNPTELYRWPIYRQQQLEEKARAKATSAAAPAGEATISHADGHIPPAAIEHLKGNPHLRNKFDELYGTGSAAQILGG